VVVKVKVAEIQMLILVLAQTPVFFQSLSDSLNQLCKFVEFLFVKKSNIILIDKILITGF